MNYSYNLYNISFIINFPTCQIETKEKKIKKMNNNYVQS